MAMQYTSDIQAKQCLVLANALKERKNTDVAFIIGENKTEYKINRFLISLISPVFDAMLYGQMKESERDSDVIIEDIQSEIFQCIINSAYCNDPKITEKNVLLVAQACDKYQIKTLTNICTDYIRSILTANNFCTYFHEAIQMNLTIFVSLCYDYLKKSEHAIITQIVNHASFVQLDLKEMRLFLETSPLAIKEEEIWEAVLKWADHQSLHHEQLESNSDEKTNQEDTKYDENIVKTKEMRLYLLKSVRDLIRFASMKGSYFAKNVATENVLTDKELIAVFTYFHHPEAGCGEFKTIRLIPKIVPFKLKMAVAVKSYANTYAALITDNLKEGCGSRYSYPYKENYIEATFDKMINVTKIEIAPICGEFKHFESVKLQRYDEENSSWIIIKQFNAKEINANEITTINVNFGDIIANKMRFWRMGALRVACFRFTGVPYLK